jgi:ribosomal protein L37E
MKQCPRCSATNDVNARFCANCGYTATTVNQQQYAVPIKKKSKLLLPLGILGGVIGLCALFGIIGGISNMVDKNKTNQGSTITVNSSDSGQTSKPKTIQAPPVEKAAPTKSETGVTMANFNKIKTGMTYSEVVKILGSEGEVMSENEMAGYKTEMYQWQGDSFVSNMNAMFQNRKLISKAQFGLK